MFCTFKLDRRLQIWQIMGIHRKKAQQYPSEIRKIRLFYTSLSSLRTEARNTSVLSISAEMD